MATNSKSRSVSKSSKANTGEKVRAKNTTSFPNVLKILKWELRENRRDLAWDKRELKDLCTVVDENGKEYADKEIRFLSKMVAKNEAVVAELAKAIAKLS